jgi:hypothetical protein
LLIAVAVAVFVLEDIVDDDEELLPLSDAGPVCRSIMRAHSECCPKALPACSFFIYEPDANDVMK